MGKRKDEGRSGEGGVLCRNEATETARAWSAMTCRLIPRLVSGFPFVAGSHRMIHKVWRHTVAWNCLVAFVIVGTVSVGSPRRASVAVRGAPRLGTVGSFCCQVAMRLLMVLHACWARGHSQNRCCRVSEIVGHNGQLGSAGWFGFFLDSHSAVVALVTRYPPINFLRTSLVLGMMGRWLRSLRLMHHGSAAVWGWGWFHTCPGFGGW